MRITHLFQPSIPWRTFFEVLILVLNALIWYYMTLNTLNNISKTLRFKEIELLIIFTLYHIAIIGSSAVGCFLFNNVQKLYFLYSWMFFGIVASLALTFLNISTFSYTGVAFFLLGVVFGFGLPTCLAYFADHTLIENRGLVGGLVSLTVHLSFIPVILIFKILDVIVNYAISATWRFLGLILFWFLTYKKETINFKTKEQKSFLSILHNRKFLLYLLPWFMVWLVDRSERHLLRDFMINSFGTEFYSFTQLTSVIIICLFAFISGVLSDLIGRKRVVTIGFVALGLGYAVVSLAPLNLFSWYFWIIADGLAWGTFFTLFVLILWGDLSSPSSREKYYLLGNIPFFLTSFIQLFLGPLVALIEPASAFSLASFFLFLAVLPLMYAPETLPERKIRLRQLRSYVEAAKKVREKYVKKTAGGG